MLAVTRFRVPDEETESWLALAREALDALSRRPGFVRARLGRAPDEPSSWVMSTEWEGVGAYRRALSSYDVKLRVTEVFHRAVHEAGAFDVVVSLDQGEGST